MNPLIIPLALACGLVLASVGVSLLALVRAKAAVQEAARRAVSVCLEQSSEIAALRQTVEGLREQIQEIRAQPAAAAPAGAQRAALNLSKRSQALRMHRRGDPLPEIASTLEIPGQEVELLLKVHRIVMSNI